MSVGSTIALAARALLMPWSLDQHRVAISRLSATTLAVIYVAAASACSTLLSTWTYLAGKGLILAAGEMDMGRDDLPADSIGQVAAALLGSVATWVVLLTLAILICLVVADVLYLHDRPAWRASARRTAAMTGWFVVWALLVLAANSVRQGETRNPAAAIRSYAQLSQRWFRGSSAENPGPVEREPLVANGRLRLLAIAFPIVWSLSLPRRTRGPLQNRLALICLGVALSWVAWVGLWRLLPWSAIDAFAG